MKATGFSEAPTAESSLNHPIATQQSAFLDNATKAIERVVRRYEPRLKSVAVTVQPDVNKFDRTLRLRITAVLRTEPIPERVVFDSELDPAVGIEIKAVS